MSACTPIFRRTARSPWSRRYQAASPARRSCGSIAFVAEKYHVPLVKLTGGQRIDLLGIRKDDLPKVWHDLDMPSGYAYGKSYRTCKSCVGSDFCRFGLGDSISLAVKIETEFQGFDSPHKLKLATAGCPAELLGGNGEGCRSGGGGRRQMGDLHRRRRRVLGAQRRYPVRGRTATKTF